MLTDREIQRGLYRIAEGMTLERLKEMGVNASVGYKRPKSRAHWVELPYPSQDGHLWIGMPRARMERCVILGAIPTSNKPTLGRILKTLAKEATYAYVGFGDYWHITRGETHATLHDFNTTRISGGNGQIVFEETPSKRRPVKIPNRTPICLLDRPEIAFKIPGVREITLFDHRHKAVLNPHKAGKSEHH